MFTNIPNAVFQTSLRVIWKKLLALLDSISQEQSCSSIKKNLKIVFQVVLKSGVIFEERSGAEKII